MADRARYDDNQVPSLIAVSNADGLTPVLLEADPSTHALIVQATISTAGLATSANQTNGAQKTQIVDGSGNVVGETNNALDVNIKSGGGAGTVDEAAFTAGTSNFTGIGGVYNDTIQSLTSGQQGVARLTSDRRLKVDAGLLPSGVTLINNQQVAGTDITTVADGTQLVSMAGPLGDPIDTTGNALNSYLTNSNLPVTPNPTNNKTVTGNINGLNQSIVIGPLDGMGSISISHIGTFSGTLVIDLWNDPTFSGNGAIGTFYVAIAGSSFSAALVTSYSGNSSLLAFINTYGFRYARVRCSAYTSGLTTAALSANTQPISFLPNAVASDGQTGSTAPLGTALWNYNGTNWERTRSVINGTNSTGTGILASGVVAQFDDVSPTSITENQFGNVRMSANRNLYDTIRDAAGNERGVNVDAYNSAYSTIRDAAGNARGVNVTVAGALQVDASTTNQPVINSASGALIINNVQLAGSDIPTVADGVGLTALAGPTGDPIDTIGSSLAVAITRTAPVADDSSTIFASGVAVQPQFSAIVAAASGANTLIGAQAGKRIRVLSYVLTSNGTVNVKWQSHTTPTDLTGLDYLVANTGVSSGYSPVGHFQSNPGEALDINLSGSVAVGGHLTYVVV